MSALSRDRMTNNYIHCFINNILITFSNVCTVTRSDDHSLQQLSQHEVLHYTKHFAQEEQTTAGKS